MDIDMDIDYDAGISPVAQTTQVPIPSAPGPMLAPNAMRTADDERCEQR